MEASKKIEHYRINNYSGSLIGGCELLQRSLVIYEISDKTTDLPF